MYGFNKIGRIADLPAHRRGNHTTGCYFHDFFVNDVKLGAWIAKMALPFMTQVVPTWFEELHTFVKANKKMLEAHVA